ncbi:hypothetical protein [Pollutimonas bauzanensis]|uniref:hypothetical protein n=1 Tax=Pollutimonas bauzanensis TaxID=658167 RepID=UPI00093284ED|nr:hypothetical protein [Pollutimonas bauzanensis]
MIAALVAAPFAAAQARDQSAHEAWIEAQKIDVQPTLKVTETQIPADSATGASSSSTTAPGGTGANGSMSEPRAPSSNMPSSSGGYAPAAPSTNMPQEGGAPVYTQPGVNPGSGMRSQ